MTKHSLPRFLIALISLSSAALFGAAEPRPCSDHSLKAGDSSKLAGLQAAIFAPHAHRVFAASDALDQFERHEFLIGIFQNSPNDCGIQDIFINGVSQGLVFGKRDNSVFFAAQRDSLEWGG